MVKIKSFDFNSSDTFYIRNENENYLANKYKSDSEDGYYIGTLTTRSRE